MIVLLYSLVNHLVEVGEVSIEVDIIAVVPTNKIVPPFLKKIVRKICIKKLLN